MTNESDHNKRGLALLNDPRFNKSTAFTQQERDTLGLRGLLPPRRNDQDTQCERALASLRRKGFDIERYIFLMALQERNERLFYRLVMDNVEEVMPLVYTPTVGQACREYAHIFRKPKGLYITTEDRGRVAEVLANWPEVDVRVIVVTDGERILGLGDLGANGMGIAVGKLALYAALGGIYPHHCLPVTLDVGTTNKGLRDDPLYLGLDRDRAKGVEYESLVDEFIEAVTERYPNILIQFEDFLTPNAYGLLRRYRERVLCFNDDIQGTAAVALAGVQSATRVSGAAFRDLSIMFLGAGSAATGIADLAVSEFMRLGLSQEEAKRRLWLVDSQGLVTANRDDLAAQKAPYAHDHKPQSLIDAVASIRPQVLIGATGSPGTFNKEVLGAMAKINDRPVIFALSNPTDRAECTAEEAYAYTQGRALFASGSPFPDVDVDGVTMSPGQGNNAYIFPGVGLGAVACGAKHVTDEMFLVAAETLASLVSEDDLSRGRLYPPLRDLRAASHAIAVAVAQCAYANDLARVPRPADLHTFIAEQMYDPTY